MLKLDNITKTYVMGDIETKALRGVSIEFRKNEFVSILGPSGCGKTTMLNIIGGLDRYTDGDLIINSKSTKDFKDKDWDNYRNHSIGFVFQGYNLISHQTVLENVEIALTLSGVSKAERRKRAIAVLTRVGLKDKIKNKPNQLSGGQMQRVAIARALVNDPEIILADEPTGALDTESSVQVMELLKEISKDKLIIMVTHNPDLAEKYSSRIVRILDGSLTDDSNPYKQEEKKDEKQLLSVSDDSELSKRELTKKNKKTHMSFLTALSLSFKNLLTKKARTILTSVAGSIGIIGIALILAISSGFNTYVNKKQEDSLSSQPIIIQGKSIDFTSIITAMFMNNALSQDVNHDKDAVYDKDSISGLMNSFGQNLKANNLKKFNQYIQDNYNKIEKDVTAIKYTYDMNLEFYLDQPLQNDVSTMEGIINLDSEIADNKVQPGSNALTNMIVKYAMAYFEEKTSATVEVQEDKSYLITKPETGFDPTFLQDYPELDDLRDALETDGTYTMSYAKVVTLSFTLIGFAGMVSGGADLNFSSNPMASMMGNMNTFNEMIDNLDLIKQQYDLVSGKYPEEDNDALLVLDKNNEVDEYMLYALGIMNDEQMDRLLKNKVQNGALNIKINYDQIVNRKSYKVLEERDYWIQRVADDDTSWFDFRTLKPTNEQLSSASETLNTNPTDPLSMQTMMNYTQYLNYYKTALDNCTNKINIVGIIRLKSNVDNGALDVGVAYTNKLTNAMIDYHNEGGAKNLPAEPNAEKKYKEIDKLNPATISIYMTEFESKGRVQAFIDEYNKNAEQGDEISYTDYAGMIMSTVSTIITSISYVLIAFVSVSLIVSSIMIGIITYISVIERTKEIGILRSVGASKRDIRHVFTAESFIIGLTSGVFGILVTILLTIPINLILKNLTGIAGIATLPILGALILILISVILTLIAGLIPARLAAKKDPVVALRTE